jgi:uncharacterized membrane protein YfcA
MFGAALAMWRGPVSESNAVIKSQWPLVFVVATAIGVLTGLLGVGGGFLIVPALVLILKVPTKTAAGTSLVAIASTSTFAFLMRFEYWSEIPVGPIAAFTLAAIASSFLAAPFAGKLNARTLQKAFAIFVSIAAAFILVIRGF